MPVQAAVVSTLPPQYWRLPAGTDALHAAGKPTRRETPVSAVEGVAAAVEVEEAVAAVAAVAAAAVPVWLVSEPLSAR